MSNTNVDKTDNGIIDVICTVEIVRYDNEEANFRIACCNVDEVKSGTPIYNANGQIVIVGTAPPMLKGEQFQVKGLLTYHPKFGAQYDIKKICNTIEAETTDVTLQKKLLSIVFTELQVKSMYEVLDNPYNVLKNQEYDKLVKVKGCGLKSAVKWVERFQKYIGWGKIYTELADYHLTDSMISKLEEKYHSPDLIIEKVKKNPYILCTEIHGIGWKTADKLALSGGLDPCGKERMGAYALFYLDEQGEKGRSWIYEEELINSFDNNLGTNISFATIREAVQELMPDPIWYDNKKKRIGLRKNWELAERIAKQLLRLKKGECELSTLNWEESIEKVEQQNGWAFNDEQKIAIKAVIDNNVVVIHGEAGTGKSSLVSAINEIFNGYKIVQCALSGRASARMQEITGRESYTIHRLLGYPAKGGHSKNHFAFHDDNPLNVDIIILDEISMVNASMFYYLIRALPTGTKLICLGDMGQLEPIGNGNVAHDMVYSSVIPTVHLSQIHRQAQKSAIVTESRKIRQGRAITDNNWVGTQTKGELQDLTITCFSDKDNTASRMVQAFNGIMDSPNFDIKEVQLLSLTKQDRYLVSTSNLNKIIQKLYNPTGRSVTIQHLEKPPMIIREGDKVINMKNNYNTTPPIFNGNIGIVKTISEQEGIMTVDFLDIGLVTLSRRDWSGLNLGYAITVHKAQGSQFDTVIVGINSDTYTMLDRQTLYTAITRAKKKCILVAENKALHRCIDYNKASEKQTFLPEQLEIMSNPLRRAF